MRQLWGAPRIAAIVVSLVALASCSRPPKTSFLPELTPVDPGRPHFIYPAVEGTACGEHAFERAIEDLFRISGGVHGFVTAVVEEERSGDRCVRVVARPITYGCEPAPPKKLDVPGPMQVLPGPESCAEAPEDPCLADCDRYAGVLGAPSTASSALRERCVTRCRANDAPFMQCARAATTVEAVQACDAL